RFGQSITFKDSEAKAMQIFLHLLRQRRAARDQVSHLSAHSLMDREKDDRAEIERRVVAYPGVELDHVVGEIGDPIAAFSESRFDTAVQHFPQRRNADHACNMPVLNGFREILGGQLRSEEHTSELQSQSNLV